MFGSLARRERRPLWGALSMILAAGVGFSLWTAADARRQAAEEAAADATLVAQTELAPLLQPRDLMAPIVGDRAKELRADVDSTITKGGAIDGVRIYSSLGRILYAADQKVVGTRPSYLRDLTFRVANGTPETQVRGGELQTFVPIWLSPGGTVAVAELSQPFAPIAAAANGNWPTIAIAAGVLLAAASLMFVRTLGRTPAAAQGSLYIPAVVRRTPKDQQAPATDSPMYQHAGFRALEEQRAAAEARATAAEENFRAIQKQLKDTLGRMKELEGRLAMNETQHSTADGELQVLRDQLRETAERLHKAELDNNQMRERLALRQQELDEARHQVAAVHGDAVQAGELRERLVTAEERVIELARYVDRLEAELDYTKSKFHMTKLSEALREFDNDEIEIEEEDDLFEHPVIIRNGSRLSTKQKAR